MARRKFVPLFQQSSIPKCRVSHKRKIRQRALEKQFFRGDKPGNNGDNRRDLCRMSSPRYAFSFRKIARENRP
jgi:hypothetical protein